MGIPKFFYNTFQNHEYLIVEKIDYKKILKNLYEPSSKNVAVIDVPDMNFLMIDGQGNPNNSPVFGNAVEALYGAAYKLKFMVKETGQLDYVIPPLEGLWWSDNMDDFIRGDKDKWKWTLMIMQPGAISSEMVTQAMDIVRKKKKLPLLDKLRFEKYTEGLSAQIMHIGSFDDEAPNIDKLHKFIKETGHKLCGKHHEIYLSDFRRVTPDKLRTVLRQPMS